MNLGLWTLVLAGYYLARSSRTFEKNANFWKSTKALVKPVKVRVVPTLSKNFSETDE